MPTTGKFPTTLTLVMSSGSISGSSSSCSDVQTEKQGFSDDSSDGCNNVNVYKNVQFQQDDGMLFFIL